MLMALVAAQAQEPVVYETREITPEALVKIYKALGRKAEGNVAVKISTGESEKTGYLRPAFIKPLLDEVKGTIVECNTAYRGTRF
ncbi:MAG: ferredoxin, partial [Prevotella sp.]